MNWRPTLKSLPALVALLPLIGRAAEPPIVDKTLVVWAAPANLTQRGGSVLTMNDQRGHFDGIVFGERATARWMAGSDNHRRSRLQQDAWPAETADANMFVRK